ncbi:uracil-DNA glycosylase family 4 [Rhodoblastus acidophilus]|uniref:uracil-DNA glycosylase n=1 Tax=Rhodoblastus acidophilus TaxID=1074 RepID=UPI002224CF32|nr:uracil-DNA glycosylase [Rhodoblastus acidophilus]MCW2282920.1 uracil-DNA glycosylase family 4 [Rhodoblastus acidophilus]MCW2331781.1 uracil-DNA glycosylase family 4 [Rhodoblastus acidophilus]
MSLTAPASPNFNCALCPRLAGFRVENRRLLPDGFNGPVPSFGPLTAPLLIVGLAPGLRGANFTGRPFTGDYAGDLLYAALLNFGFASGVYAATPRDGVQLFHCRITNAVRCVPPQNKPTPQEITTCRCFLAQEMAAMPGLRALLCLGRISHDSAVKALGLRAKDAPFGHGAVHRLASGLTLYDSYHCSRYNTNTGVLTSQMFDAVFEKIVADLKIGSRESEPA